MEKYKNCMRFRLFGDKKQTDGKYGRNRAFAGLSEIQCLIYHQNNVNPFEICKNWILLNMVFRVIIIFFWKYENLISASTFSDFLHN